MKPRVSRHNPTHLLHSQTKRTLLKRPLHHAPSENSQIPIIPERTAITPLPGKCREGMYTVGMVLYLREVIIDFVHCLIGCDGYW